MTQPQYICISCVLTLVLCVAALLHQKQKVSRVSFMTFRKKSRSFITPTLQGFHSVVSTTGCWVGHSFRILNLLFVSHFTFDRTIYRLDCDAVRGFYYLLPLGQVWLRLERSMQIAHQ